MSLAFDLLRLKAKGLEAKALGEPAQQERLVEVVKGLVEVARQQEVRIEALEARLAKDSGYLFSD